MKLETRIACMHGALMDLAIGIEANRPVQVTAELTCLRNDALAIMNANSILPIAWEHKNRPQDVFIEPVAFHAFIKLQSAVGLFCTSAFLKNPEMLIQSMCSIEHYIDFIASQYLEPRTLTATDGEAKAPLVAKGTRKGKK